MGAPFAPEAPAEAAGPPPSLAGMSRSASAPDIAAWQRARLSATLAALQAPEAAPKVAQPALLRDWTPSASMGNLAGNLAEL